MSKWICFLFLILKVGGYETVLAQGSADAAARATTADSAARSDLEAELGKTSSSFVPNPDPLDPLPLKQESLKDDDEPVLEDIKQILNSPLKKKKAASPAKDSAANAEGTDSPMAKPSAVEADGEKLPQLNQARDAKKKKRSSPKTKNQTSTQNSVPRSPDDPDFKLETRLHEIYKTYNAEPTSPTEWSRVNEGRSSHELVVEPGNTLDGISRMLFGDSKFWPKIWSLNNPGILNPHQIYPGFKLFFYPGTEMDAPAVSINKSAVSKSKPSDDFNSQEKANIKERTVFNFGRDRILTTGKNPDGRDYGYQNTELNKIMGYSDNSEMQKPQPLPRSLPEHHDKNYFRKSGQVSPVIRLRKHQQIPDAIPANPYILTVSTLETDYRVADSQIEKLVCRDNQYIQTVDKKNLSAMPGLYKIVESLPAGKNRFKKTNIYRVIGTAEIGEDNSMRIKGCNNLVNSDALLVSEDKLSQLTPPTETFAQDGTIVESLNNENQGYFNENEFVVISSANAGFAQGQDLNVYSESEGAIVGKVKVLQVLGTLAIGYVQDVQSVIQFGDQLQIAGGGLNSPAALSPLDSPSLDSLPPLDPVVDPMLDPKQSDTSHEMNLDQSTGSSEDELSL